MPRAREGGRDPGALREMGSGSFSRRGPRLTGERGRAVESLNLLWLAANGALNILRSEGTVSPIDERQWARVFQATGVPERLERLRH